MILTKVKIIAVAKNFFHKIFEIHFVLYRQQQSIGLGTVPVNPVFHELSFGIKFNIDIICYWIYTPGQNIFCNPVYAPYTFSLDCLFSNNSCQRLVEAANHPKHHINRISDAYIAGILRLLAQIHFYKYSNLDYSWTYHNGMSCDQEFERRPHLLVCTSKLNFEWFIT